jgi:hypothetical protein
MNADEFNTRIAALSPEQQLLMRSVIEEVITIIEQPQLPAVLVRVLPSSATDAFAVVTAHCLCANPHDAHHMLMGFLAAHAAVISAAMPQPDEVRH